MVSLPAKPDAGNSRPDNAAPRLQPVEIEVIQLFVQLSRVLGQPRSLGEIYGLLFISPRPLAMDDIMARLKLSKGSTSEGLKFLRNLGAVQMRYVPGDRRVHYEAVAELRNLASSFLREKIEPHLGAGEQRLKRLTALAHALSAEERDHVTRRITTLRTWSRNGRRVLPLVLRVLGG
jgi:DNA-binding transcriptional regulator GbsR (MarR family)